MKHATKLHTLYYAAIDADNAYTDAIVAQFGKRHTRWTTDHKLYNAATKLAYDRKVNADAALHAEAVDGRIYLPA